MTELWTLLTEFARLGLVSFGGTNVAEMERVLVGEQGWLSAAQLADGFALGQLMPGPNMLSVTYYGFVVAGVNGALAATLGFYGPTALVSALVALSWQRYSEHRWVSSFRAALLPFGAGVAMAGSLVLAQGSIHDWRGVVIAATTLLLLWKTRINAPLLVLGAALVGGFTEMT